MSDQALHQLGCAVVWANFLVANPYVVSHLVLLHRLPGLCRKLQYLTTAAREVEKSVRAFKGRLHRYATYSNTVVHSPR